MRVFVNFKEAYQFLLISDNRFTLKTRFSDEDMNSPKASRRAMEKCGMTPGNFSDEEECRGVVHVFITKFAFNQASAFLSD